MTLPRFMSHLISSSEVSSVPTFRARSFVRCSRRSFISSALKVSLGCVMSGSACARAASPVLDTNTQNFLNFSDFGGVPSATSPVLLAAFDAAFAKLKKLGGGVLLVSPGDYDLGNYSASSHVISIYDLSNVLISAYGARFQATSKAAITPFLFVFHNPNNVVMAGANFIDLGFNESAWLSHGRWGMFCVCVDSKTICGNFKLVDCYATNVTALYSNDSRSNKFKVKNVVIENCKVTNAYYGVAVLYPGENLSVRNLICQDVLRGFISYGSKNVDMDIKLHCSANFAGSNGFIELACEGSNEGDVENVRIKLDVSGVESHTGLVHFYHQQKDSPGSIKNVNANVNVNQLTTEGKNAKLGKLNIFVFDHELPSTAILASTKRVWDQITLSGKVVGSISGDIISAPTVSQTPGVLIIDDNLSARVNLSVLATKFKIKRLSNESGKSRLRG